MNNMKDLVSRVINGDKHAFEEIYQATYRQVYYTCMSFLKNEQNAQDIMQDTYITALTHMQQLENPERITAWLNRIAVNKCKDFLAKNMPEEFREDILETEMLEENDNFLPENYVTNNEKRKIVLDIMQDELSAVQYQTIILYYYDEMSVSEIAACMNCPEGTVTYRLSSARGKIKRAVQEYEDTSGVKLYSSGAIPLLTAIFIAEAEKLVIPNVLNGIFSSIGIGVGAQTIGAAASTATVSAMTGATATNTVATATGKLGFKGLFHTLKAKIVTGVVATAVVAGGATGLVLLNKTENTQENNKQYTEVNTVIIDNDYVTVTVDKIYDKGYIPDKKETMLPVDENSWNPEDCIVELNLENKSDEIVLVDMNFFTVNNESIDYGLYSNNTYMLDPHSTQINCINNNTNILNIDNHEYLKIDRDPITWAKVGYRVYTLDENYSNETFVEYNLTDIYFYNERKLAPNYERKTKNKKEQVLLDNDQLKVTYIGTDMIYDENYQSLWARPFLYVENKSDHDIRIRCYGDYVCDLSSSCIFAGTNGYITDLNLKKADSESSTDSDSFVYEMIKNDTPFQFDIHISDYTELAGGYINTHYQSNSLLPNGMDSIEFEQYLSDSETIYPVQIINFECEKESY